MSDTRVNRVIIWSPGYAESASLGHIISSTHFLTNGKCFASRREAVETLAEDLWQQFNYLVRENNKFHHKYPKVHPTLIEPSRDKFVDFITKMPGCITDDGVADEDLDIDYQLSFSPFWVESAVKVDMSRGDFIFIGEAAETIFCIALSKKYPEIFKDFAEYQLKHYEEVVKEER